MNIRERIKNVMIAALNEEKPLALKPKGSGSKGNLNPGEVPKVKGKTVYTSNIPTESHLHYPGFGRPASEAPPVKPVTRRKSPGGGKEGIPGLES